jgi:hypothetical protein
MRHEQPEQPKPAQAAIISKELASIQPGDAMEARWLLRNADLLVAEVDVEWRCVPCERSR